MYELYEKMMKAYNEKNTREFEIAARMLVDNDFPNPFPDETVEHNLFFKAKRYRMKWRAGGIDMRSSRRNMMAMLRQLAELQPANPYTKGEYELEQPTAKKELPTENPVKEEIVKEEVIAQPVNQEKKELNEDVVYLMKCMVEAYNKGDDAEYEMYVTHLMDTAEENPFLLGSNEYEMFSVMMSCYKKNPPNKRRTFVVGKHLCEFINHTETGEEESAPKQTVLGVVPDEKKNWFKFLFPWKKEGEQDDSQGSN